jgi:hypothetical protein
MSCHVAWWKVTVVSEEQSASLKMSLSIRLHSGTSEKTAIFIFTTVGTSNLIQKLCIKFEFFKESESDKIFYGNLLHLLGAGEY